MTRELLDKMPDSVIKRLDDLRRDYNSGFNYAHQNAVRSRAAGYVQGLCDAGLITEREKSALFIYTTV